LIKKAFRQEKRGGRVKIRDRIRVDLSLTPVLKHSRARKSRLNTDISVSKLEKGAGNLMSKFQLMLTMI
jgi:hypothetical protein